MSRVPARLAWLVVAAALVSGLLLMRDRLMTVHQPSAPGSATDVLVDVRSRGDGAGVPARTRVLIDGCRLRVSSAVRLTALRETGSRTFAFRLEPALDHFDERELRGCLQDTREELLLLHVRRVRRADVAPGG